MINHNTTPNQTNKKPESTTHKQNKRHTETNTTISEETTKQT